MKHVQFILSETEPTIQTAISDFVKAEFEQAVSISTHNNAAEAKKDLASVVEFIGVAVGISMTIIAFLPKLNDAMTFVDKVNRLKRVKKLKNVIDSNKKPIYLQIGEESPIDITQKSADEIVNLLEKIDELKE